MQRLRLEGPCLLIPSPTQLPNSSCMRWQRKHSRQNRTATSCFLGRPKQEQEVILLVDPEPPAQERPRTREMTYMVGLFFLAAAFAVKRWRYMRSRKAEEEYGKRRWGQARVVNDVGYPQSHLDSKEYQLALARTRQAMHVHKAAAFMNTSNSTRAVVELQRAMQENSVARCPVLGAQHEGGTMSNLYRLYVSDTEMPAKYSTLLQLRELLDIKEQEAEHLEAEVLGSSSSFSI
ncbi:hypothetical protein CVIRNUC_002373 [Coccomyxa viridis]|uniref:Uncharacterized protein n=1 Tax=Coccomyxa viridis TaxID=1274662 RepID=A0AAV1HX79_9CHLO|nr:hypothetical protein CVIRNUC_002373 [Coccomyxa viridis]